MKKTVINLINGGDTISESIGTINRNFLNIGEALDRVVAGTAAGVESAKWTGTGSKSEGPGLEITMSDGTTVGTSTKFPAAGKNRAGVVTAEEQTFGGRKRFESGVSTDTITDVWGRKTVVSGERSLKLGGDGGIEIRYDDAGRITGITYPGMRETDLTDVIGRINNVRTSVTLANERIDGLTTTYSGHDNRPKDTIENMHEYWQNDDISVHEGDTYRSISRTGLENDTYVLTKDSSGTYEYDRSRDVRVMSGDGNETEWFWKCVTRNSSTDINVSEIAESVMEQIDTSVIVDEVVDRMGGLTGGSTTFGKTTLPTNYKAGDVWFFDGDNSISPAPSAPTGLVAGNIYRSGSDSTGFDASHWTSGVDVARSIKAQSASAGNTITTTGVSSGDDFSKSLMEIVRDLCEITNIDEHNTCEMDPSTENIPTGSLTVPGDSNPFFTKNSGKRIRVHITGSRTAQQNNMLTCMFDNDDGKTKTVLVSGTYTGSLSEGWYLVEYIETSYNNGNEDVTEEVYNFIPTVAKIDTIRNILEQYDILLVKKQ